MKEQRNVTGSEAWKPSGLDVAAPAPARRSLALLVMSIVDTYTPPDPDRELVHVCLLHLSPPDAGES